MPEPSQDFDYDAVFDRLDGTADRERIVEIVRDEIRGQLAAERLETIKWVLSVVTCDAKTPDQVGRRALCMQKQYFQNKTVQDLADIFGCSRARAHRVLTKQRKILDKHPMSQGDKTARDCVGKSDGLTEPG